MMLVLETIDGGLIVFPSAASATGHCELIDVENGEYEFCDHEGQRYVHSITSRTSFFSPGGFTLVPEGTPDTQNALKLIDRARYLQGKRCNLSSMDELKAFISKGKGVS